MRHHGVTLALGGGGARGVAHLGVIEEVVRAGWKIDRIIGISVGSLAGAMYAFDPVIDVVERRTLDFLLSPDFLARQRELLRSDPSDEDGMQGSLFAWYHSVTDYLQAQQRLTRAITRSSLLPGALLEEVVTNLLPDADISDAEIPLGVAAVDLRSGARVVLERGPLRKAVQASASIPGIFPPVEFDGRLLCDLGVVASIPSRLVGQRYAGSVIAVDVGSNLKPPPRTMTALDILMRMTDIGEVMFREDLRADADLVITPDVGDIHWSDFSQSDALIEIGRQAAREALKSFRKPRGWRTFLLHPFRHRS